MVSVPVLLKLAAVVETLLLLPPIVSFPEFVANPASAFVLFDVFSMVPPARVRVRGVRGDGLRRASDIQVRIQNIGSAVSEPPLI